jgi:uncharacterized protein YebE (UPF0316 family)
MHCAGVQLSYVALFCLRSVFMVKGKRNIPVIVGTLEIFAYIKGLAMVLNNTNSPLGIFIYCGTYAFEIFLGMTIERKLALGTIVFQIISLKESGLCSRLKEEGFGVTSWEGQGSQGVHDIHLELAKRKDTNRLNKTIKSFDLEAFIIAYEPTGYTGGYGVKKGTNHII